MSVAYSTLPLALSGALSISAMPLLAGSFRSLALGLGDDALVGAGFARRAVGQGFDPFDVEREQH